MSVKGFVFSLIFIVAALLVHGTTFAAAPARTLGFNGQLFDGASPLTGSINATFTLYDSASGGNVTGSPISKTVTVNKGYFNTQFSEADLSGVNFDQTLFLQVNVNGTDLSPRTAINSSVSALKAFGAFSHSSAPSVGPAGSLYFNTSDGKLYVSNGSTWIGAGASPWLLNGTSTYYSEGNVGIGTSTPERVLTVDSGGSSNALFTGAGGSAYTSFTQTQGTSSEFRIWPHNNGNIYIQHDRDIQFTQIANTASRFSIGVSGNVGVGTSSPVAALGIQRNVASAQGLWISNIGTTASSSARITLSSYGSVEGIPSYIDWNAYNQQLRYVAGRNGLGRHVFSTVTGGEEQPRMTILNNGNAGIGTTTPTAKLSIVGALDSTDDVLLAASSSGATLFSVSPTGRTVINRSRELSPVLAHSDNQGGFHLIGVPGNQNTLVMYGTGNANNVLVGYAHSGTASVPAPTASGNFLMRMVGGGYTGSAFTGKAEVAIIASETWSSTSTGAYITFRTTANGQTTTTEKMRVDSNGFVGIGTTTPTASLHASGTIRFSSLGAGTLSTDSLGNVTVSSDERLKNIQGMFTTGLEKIKALSPILYRWKSETGYDTENSYAGFSAQNVQESIPEAVSTDAQGHLTLSDRPILAALVNAIKELATTMDGFADKLATKLVDAEKVKAKDIETDKLCIKNTCVTEEQLQVLMLSSGQAVGAQTQPSVVETPQATTTATSTESVATTTEAVVQVVEVTEVEPAE